jgi:4-hydroxy-tetrahydrodipicolinate synthase
MLAGNGGTPVTSRAHPLKVLAARSRLMSSPLVSGPQVAIVTPFRDDGQIDWQAWARLLDWHVSSGTSGVVVGGTTGESPTLSDAELSELTQRARAQVGNRLQIIVGCGTNSTAGTVERVRQFSALAPDGLLLVTPAYNRPSQEGLYRHYEAAAQASSVPVILYNVPSRTAVDLLPETVSRLARLPRVAGLKEAVASMQRIRELVAPLRRARRASACCRGMTPAPARPCATAPPASSR